MSDKTERVKKYFEDNPWDVTAVIDSMESPAWRYIYMERAKSIFDMLQLNKYRSIYLAPFYNHKITQISTRKRIIPT